MTLPIESIIQDGMKAPSGENCQPWKFVVEDTVLYIYNIPEADLSLYNTMQRGSYVAHGALIENITLSAKKYGYDTHIQLFPNSNDSNCVATISFEVSEKEVDILYEAIHARSTNRKDFFNEKLSVTEKELLTSVVPDMVIIDDDSSMKAVGQALAVHEKVLFENKAMHDFFYDHIFWNKEDENRAGGFFIDTLEFLPHQLQAVKLFKHWFLLRIGNALLKVSTMISKENGEKYAAGGAFGMILLEGTTNADYVALGRKMERLWLTATKHGIAMHPCNGTLYLMSRLTLYGEGEFSKAHVKLITEAYKTIVAASGNQKRQIGFIFRMGKAEKPTATATRLPPSITYHKKE
jgi:hypothetical protein